MPTGKPFTVNFSVGLLFKPCSSTKSGSNLARVVFFSESELPAAKTMMSQLLTKSTLCK